MLPLSSERYEQFRDYSLLVRRVSFRDLGPYTCQAYNGYGRPSSYTVVLQAFGPVYSVDTDDIEFRRYLLPPPQPDPRLLPSTTTTTTPAPFRPRPQQPYYTQAPRPSLGNQFLLTLISIFHFLIINKKKKIKRRNMGLKKKNIPNCQLTILIEQQSGADCPGLVGAIQLFSGQWYPNPLWRPRFARSTSHLVQGRQSNRAFRSYHNYR